MDRDKAITATFGYEVVVTVVGRGLVTKSPTGPYYAPGDSVDLVAAPRRGYHFVGWTGDAVGSQPRLRVVMNANKAITATFAVDSYVLDVGKGVGN